MERARIAERILVFGVLGCFVLVFWLSRQPDSKVLTPPSPSEPPRQNTTLDQKLNQWRSEERLASVPERRSRIHRYGVSLDSYEGDGVNIRVGMSWDDFIGEVVLRPMKNEEILPGPGNTLIVVKRLEIDRLVFHVRAEALPHRPSYITAIWAQPTQ